MRRKQWFVNRMFGSSTLGVIQKLNRTLIIVDLIFFAAQLTGVDRIGILEARDSIQNVNQNVLSAPQACKIIFRCRRYFIARERFSLASYTWQHVNWPLYKSIRVVELSAALSSDSVALQHYDPIHLWFKMVALLLLVAASDVGPNECCTNLSPSTRK